jgi:polar amino acid transport system permease protein
VADDLRADDPSELDDDAPRLRPPQGRSRRAQIERQQRIRASVLALVSCAVVFGVLAVIVVKSENWPEVRDSFFSRSQFRASFPDVLDAFWLNVKIFLIAEALILVLALLLAVVRSSRSPWLFPLRVMGAIYGDVARGTPILLVLLLLTFGVPALRIDGVPNDAVFWATTALVFSYTAYVAEVFRAGIDSIHDSQRAAARSLGLSSGQALRFVVLPQAVRRVIPPLLNDFIALQKETSLVSVVGPIEAVRTAQIDSSLRYNYTPYLAAAVIFLLLTIPMTRVTDWLIARQRTRVSAGAVR